MLIKMIVVFLITLFITVKIFDFAYYAGLTKSRRKSLLKFMLYGIAVSTVSVGVLFVIVQLF